MDEKITALIETLSYEMEYDENEISAETRLSELMESESDFEEILHIIECEFYVDLSDEINEDTTIGQIAELIEI